MNILLIITWIMFIGLFLLSFFWLKKAFRIGIKKDYSYVALKRGIPPKDPQRYATCSFLINLISGAVLATIILLVVLIGLSFEIWTAIAGLTIWIKLFSEFILSRQALLAVK